MGALSYTGIPDIGVSVQQAGSQEVGQQISAPLCSKCSTGPPAHHLQNV